MNASHKDTAVSSAEKSCGSFLSTLGDVGVTWAAYGLKIGKMALETSADTLGKTAKALDTLAAELSKKAAEEKAAEPVEAPQEAVKPGNNGVAPDAPAPAA